MVESVNSGDFFPRHAAEYTLLFFNNKIKLKKIVFEVREGPEEKEKELEKDAETPVIGQEKKKRMMLK